MKNIQFKKEEYRDILRFYHTHFVLRYDINSPCIAIYRYIVTPLTGSTQSNDGYLLQIPIWQKDLGRCQETLRESWRDTGSSGDLPWGILRGHLVICGSGISRFWHQCVDRTLGPEWSRCFPVGLRCVLIIEEKKEEIWLNPMTKAPTPSEKKNKKQRYNTYTPPKTTITQRLRTD